MSQAIVTPVAYEPSLVPSAEMMRQEGVYVLEEWFRWAEEWSMLLRIYGGITRTSSVLEIGCGYGRIAFPLRYVLLEGSYEGFDICRDKITFLTQNFQKAHPHFRFTWANVHNQFYNPDGQTPAKNFHFPYADRSFDLIYAASVFTHLLPENAENYFRQAARVLKVGGRCVFSFFLMDYYRSGQARPLGFANPAFDFEHEYESYGEDFAIAQPNNPEEMTAYSLKLVEQYAKQAGLELVQSLPGLWSGSTSNWVGAQDVVILQKPL